MNEAHTDHLEINEGGASSAVSSHAQLQDSKCDAEQPQPCVVCAREGVNDSCWGRGWNGCGQLGRGAERSDQSEQHSDQHTQQQEMELDQHGQAHSDQHEQQQHKQQHTHSSRAISSQQHECWLPITCPAQVPIVMVAAGDAFG